MCHLDSESEHLWVKLNLEHAHPTFLKGHRVKGRSDRGKGNPRRSESLSLHALSTDDSPGGLGYGTTRQAMKL